MRTSWLSFAAIGLATAAQIPFQLRPDAASIASTYPSTKSVNLLSHDALPAHSLRVSQPDPTVCERHPGTRSWSGYLDVDVDKLRSHRQLHEPDGRVMAEELQYDAEKEHHTEGVIEHFYFWAFESRNDPVNGEIYIFDKGNTVSPQFNLVTDPVMLWLNGGPGCSSFTGLLMELGPCNAIDPNSTADGKPGTEWNPWSWTSNATVLFLDQPVGTGFSYSSWADKSRKDTAPGRIYSTPAAARDASAFLHLFNMHAKQVFTQDSLSASSKKDPHFAGIKSFHMAGESYFGRYGPLIASQVLRDNKEALKHPERGLDPLPLVSVLMGNGITSPKHQYPAYTEFACTNKSGHEPFFPKAQCDTMFSKVPVCLKLTENCNRHSPLPGYDTLACQTASTFCEGALSAPWGDTGRSYYDWDHMGDYIEEKYVAAFLNDDYVRSELGIDRTGAGDAHDGVFVGCSDDVYNRFAQTGDGARDSSWAVGEILDNGVKVLIYSGERDFICNSLGGNAWTSDLEWSGKEGFNKEEFKPWFVGEGKNKKEAGTYRTFGNFTFTGVHDSGHFLPKDKPEAALTMVNRWLHTPGDGNL